MYLWSALVQCLSWSSAAVVMWAAATVRLARLLGLPVLAIDDREEYAQQLRDAGADNVLCLPFEQALKQVPGSAETYFIIVTRAHAFDVICLEQILRKPCGLCWDDGQPGTFCTGAPSAAGKGA